MAAEMDKCSFFHKREREREMCLSIQIFFFYSLSVFMRASFSMSYEHSRKFFEDTRIFTLT